MKHSPDHQPPAWIRKLLGVFLDPRMLEASLGDLEEKFKNNIRNHIPPWKASLSYIFEGLGFLKMSRWRKSISLQATVNLIRHTFLFTTRLVRRDKGYYTVSLAGLALSLTSFLLITMFIQDELSYDQFHVNRNRIFKLTTHITINDLEYHQATSQFPAGPALQAEFGEVEEIVRVHPQDWTLESGDKKYEEHILLADENFLDVFTFPLILGDQKTAMTGPASIILTSSTARKYFGTENPIGRVIVVDKNTLHVTGVIDDVPEQSHMKFTAIVPLNLQLNIWKSETGIEGRENKWYWTGAHTYVVLKDVNAAPQLRAKLPVIVSKYFPERYRQKSRIELLSLNDIHLDSVLISHLEPGGNLLSLRLFSIVAVVIMVVSSINLVNLSSYKIGGRIREVGIRKFLGQNTGRIIVQLAIESLIMGLVAFIFSIILCRLFLTDFNLLVQKNLDMFSVTNLKITAMTLVVILSVCVLAVIQPAIHYASRSGYFLLKNYNHPGKTGGRNILIGLQICFSFILLAFSFIISRQVDLFKTKDLGFDKENVIVIEMNEDVSAHFDAFRNELKKTNDIISVAGGASPGSEGYNGWRFVPEGGSYEKPFMFPTAFVDHQFLSTLGIRLLAGENFNPDNNYDSLMPFIINQKAAIEMGWEQDPLNRKIEIFAPGTTQIMAKGIIIGVIDDFHFESLRRPVKPVVLTFSTWSEAALVKLSGKNNRDGIEAVEATWKKFSGKPFEYELLDDKLDKLYTNESKLSNVILFFTFIALYLTCYGMFAMSSLVFSRKLKEVAIRKVFGASQFRIIRKFYSGYAVFNLIAIAGGIPVALYLGDLWLATFEYRIGLTPDIFVQAGLYILAAGMISVSYYLARVAFSNPVKFLRRE